MSKFEGMEIEVDTASKMVIMHPVKGQPLVDKDGKEAYLMLYSSDSGRARKFARDITTSRLRMRSAKSLDGEKLDDERVALLAALADGWYLLALDGSPIDLPFSRAEAEALFGNNRLAWLREQADIFVGDRANFSTASSTT